VFACYLSSFNSVLLPKFPSRSHFSPNKLCTSVITLLANSHAPLALYLPPAHCLPIPAPSYCHFLHQHIACQYLRPSIVTSCASTLVAKIHSLLLLPLSPVHCLPIPALFYCRAFHQHIAYQYLRSSIVVPSTSTLLANTHSPLFSHLLPACYLTTSCTLSCSFILHP
jgi:hypothetical protein